MKASLLSAVLACCALAACDRLTRSSAMFTSGDTRLRIYRDAGVEFRSLDIGTLASHDTSVATIASVTSSPWSDTTIAFRVKAGKDTKGFSEARGARVCTWADSTRRWIAAPIDAPKGSDIVESREITPEANEIEARGYRLTVERSRRNGSTSLRLFVWSDGLRDSLPVHFDGIGPVPLDSFLASTCVAADSSKTIGSRR